MEFVDRATIKVQAGDGGDGVVSFRREKYIARGGPDGGDGGSGGDILLIGNKDMNSLLDYKYRSVYNATKGGKGSGGRKHGSNGDNMLLDMPVGTLVYNRATEELIGEVATEKPLLVARGGRGGIGNYRFKSSVNRTPHQNTSGESGEVRELDLELRLRADVVLIGLPNSGKSSLLHQLTGAHPKIASYPFSTLKPQPAIAQQSVDTPHITVLDLPPIVTGASQGKGLGHDFLKHALRASLLCYVVNGMDEDPCDSVAMIRQEMDHFSTELTTKPYWIVITQLDKLDKTKRAEINDCQARLNVPIRLVSTLSGEGTTELLAELTAYVEDNQQMEGKQRNA